MIAAIWDAGGIDTIDGSGYSTDSVIDLREESFSSLGAYEFGDSRMINNVAIARDVKIENAIGGTGDDTLIGNMADAQHSDSGGNGYNGNNILDGGAGNDTVSYAGSDVAVTIDLQKGGAATSGYSYDLGSNGTDTLRSIENLIGSSAADRLLTSAGGGELSGEGGHDVLAGRSGSDRLDGGLGNDKLYGNGGDDALTGGEGNDWLRGGAGGDVLDGGAGLDWADYFSSNLGVTIDLSNGTALGGYAEGDTLNFIERVRGSSHEDEITGDAAVNFLRGDGGEDMLNGNAGNDVLSGGVGADVLNGGEGWDWAYYRYSEEGVEVSLETGEASGGEAEGDSLISIERLIGSRFGDHFVGNEGKNYLRGLNGKDDLSGQGGADILRGDRGNDTLSGGAGRDTFLFSAGDGTDIVTDFEKGVDWIRFTNAVNSLDDLTISQRAAGAAIEYSNSTIILAGFDSTELNTADFLFA